MNGEGGEREKKQRSWIEEETGGRRKQTNKNNIEKMCFSCMFNKTYDATLSGSAHVADAPRLVSIWDQHYVAGVKASV